jgi:hypothetical protein
MDNMTEEDLNYYRSQASHNDGSSSARTSGRGPNSTIGDTIMHSWQEVQAKLTYHKHLQDSQEDDSPRQPPTGSPSRSHVFSCSSSAASGEGGGTSSNGKYMGGVLSPPPRQADGTSSSNKRSHGEYTNPTNADTNAQSQSSSSSSSSSSATASSSASGPPIRGILVDPSKSKWGAQYRAQQELQSQTNLQPPHSHVHVSELQNREYEAPINSAVSPVAVSANGTKSEARPEAPAASEGHSGTDGSSTISGEGGAGGYVNQHVDCSFKEKRASHYNEYFVLKALRDKLLQNEDDDEDDDEDKE